ncbi:glycosyltransferase family 2 protein [Pseudobacter ginsenosidimutans]|uniref:Glycosyltransferase n=1 Tax=Pseudobacter ginsenosidimutans TaxID=661488 RepID=A0A4Q7MW03_9BACT|nr:glycosyltransferase family 2 protein [Pseudobacter ginsenosidimutans]QEC41030.1 glycosyltransferase [Pseudobacter ginsenosidimutans]RZS72219.1 glycosyltransferase [Pseudobacter ginsenosidimutans]
MKISIITATYNSAATIRDTLSCIAMQDHPDIEHIIVDGVSKDKTLEIVREFPHVAKLISETDKGIYDAMNKGVQMAQGDVVGILNSDDFYTHAHVLSTVAEAFSNPAVQTVYADLQYVHPVQTEKVVRTWKAGQYRKNSFYYGWMPPHPTFFVRREVYEQAGLFNLALRSAADYELMLRILFRYGCSTEYIPEVLVKMRAGGMSNASFKNRLRANREDALAWKLNNLEPYFFTLYLKPIRKIQQLFVR